MLIVHTSGGRTGNQAILLCNLLASALKHKLSFVNICFKSVNLFDLEPPSFIKCLYSRFCVWFLWRLTFSRILHPLLKLFGIRFLSDTQSEPERISGILAEEAKSGIIILNVWPYTDYDALYQYQDLVRRCIKPKQSFLNNANSFISTIRKDEQIIVGVHIRRSDYKEWNNGAYYYNHETYRSFMEQIVGICDKDVHFVICSDEPIPDCVFADIRSKITISQNDFMSDLAILAQCDYIIGPPSTFASYASFYGNTPRFTIYSESDIVSSMEQFGVALIDYDDTYESYVNGAREARLHIHIKQGKIVQVVKKQ